MNIKNENIFLGKESKNNKVDNNSQQKFKVLDSFRGLCAISVMLYHMRFVGSITEFSFFRNSAIFVDFFFILSGFVLTHSYGFRDELNFKKFFKARFFRIFPLHAFMLFVFILLEISRLIAYSYFNFQFNNIPFTGKKSILEIIPNLLLIHSWSSATEIYSFNDQSWSISIEFYTYMLFFITLNFVRSKFFIWSFIALTMSYFLISQSELFQITVLRGVSCFFIGTIGYTLYVKIKHINISFIIGTIIEFIVLGLVFYAVSYIVYEKIVLIGLFFFAILIFSFESGLISKILIKDLFQYVGKLSYSIYMIHGAIWFCLISLSMIIQKITGENMSFMIDGKRILTFGSVTLNNICIMVIIFFVLWLSKFTYRHVEMYGKKISEKVFN